MNPNPESINPESINPSEEKPMTLEGGMGAIGALIEVLERNDLEAARSLRSVEQFYDNLDFEKALEALKSFLENTPSNIENYLEEAGQQTQGHISLDFLKDLERLLGEAIANEARDSGT